TNVSHDIKTPLTSIVTYVDLLKNSDNLPDELTDYVDVLDRNSKKLTKLVNDLVDASQASVGSIKVNMQPGDAGVMLTQAAAEYDERMKAAELTPVVTVPDKSLIIMADGRLLWRIFDNLLSNICKYSLSRTRVYMKAEEQNGKVRISFSNISKCPLNVSSDELLERFVRGDSSRNTEGSGLGLSIAQSLTSLQNGTLSLDIDGDLFKATIEFDKVKTI
ncbi:MAG: sensor histidine kinase, partial [Acutalibacteraceae bacterium]|nr:sensor histidine kinase [Acutalibacteraceae bacterium]